MLKAPCPESRAPLTFHFGVGLPLVEPAPEGFAVVLCTLQGSEVRAVCWAGLLVAKLVNTAGTLAELPTILRPNREKKRKKKKDFAKSSFGVIGMLHTCVRIQGTGGFCPGRSVFLTWAINLHGS